MMGRIADWITADAQAEHRQVMGIEEDDEIRQGDMPPGAWIVPLILFSIAFYAVLAWLIFW